MLYFYMHNQIKKINFSFDYLLSKLIFYIELLQKIVRIFCCKNMFFLLQVLNFIIAVEKLSQADPGLSTDLIEQAVLVAELDQDKVTNWELKTF